MTCEGLGGQLQNRLKSWLSSLDQSVLNSICSRMFLKPMISFISHHTSLVLFCCGLVSSFFLEELLFALIFTFSALLVPSSGSSLLLLVWKELNCDTVVPFMSSPSHYSPLHNAINVLPIPWFLNSPLDKHKPTANNSVSGLQKYFLTVLYI